MSPNCNAAHAAGGLASAAPCRLTTVSARPFARAAQSSEPFGCRPVLGQGACASNAARGASPALAVPPTPGLLRAASCLLQRRQQRPTGVQQVSRAVRCGFHIQFRSNTFIKQAASPFHPSVPCPDLHPVI
jgi:hypothetical protein